MERAMKEGLEGLVLKDGAGVYEPGRRHWMKMKKDYLDEGSMADTADLVVLGAYYGTGSKGGILSTFLMGCQDSKGIWRTVCKVGNGHDDATIDRINKELDVVKISKDASKVPAWLNILKSDLVPDFVVPDPDKAPVWEITGAEFSGSTSHSADGISIRFPRVTRIRDDKGAEDHTTLAELKELARKSKLSTDLKPITGSPRSTSPVLAKAKAAARDTSPAPRKARKPKRKDARSDESDSGESLADFIVDDDASEDELHRRPKKTKRARLDASDDEDGGAGGRPPCRYGAACYQKNARHKEEYAHPGDADFAAPGADKGKGKRRVVAMEEDEDGESGGEGGMASSPHGHALSPKYYAYQDDSEDEDGHGAAAAGAGGEDEAGDSGEEAALRSAMDVGPDRPEEAAVGAARKATPSGTLVLEESDGSTEPLPDGTEEAERARDEKALDAAAAAVADAAPLPAKKASAGGASVADPASLLRDVFTGLVFYVPSHFADQRKLERYIVAYNGEVVDAADFSSAVTHLLLDSWDVSQWSADTSRAVDAHKTAAVVTPAFVWDSIKAGKILPVASFQP
jgi:hypothetical protein